MIKPKLNDPDVEELKKKNLELFKKHFPNVPNEPKTLTPPEQVKQEWEELGYKWKEDEIFITLIKQKYNKSIKINKKLKDYKCYDLFRTPTLLHSNNIALFITFQEHQLLTKTFKALG